MALQDIPAVLAIELESFPIPWGESSFRFEITENPYASLFVARFSGSRQTVGFASVWVIDQEMKINNIAVHPGWRARGIGSRFIRFLLGFAVEQGCREATLEVRPSNEAALRLYAKSGFRRVGRRKNYYADTHEDALLMACPVDPGVAS